MGYHDIFTNKEFIKQVQTMQRVATMIDTPAIQEAIHVAGSPTVQQAYQSTHTVEKAMEPIREMYVRIQEMLQPVLERTQLIRQIHENYHLSTSFQQSASILRNYHLMNCCPDDLSDDEVSENKEANRKIVTEIFRADEENDANIHKKDTAIITLSPINDTILKYLSENPMALYQLTSRKFEEVMAEIYNRLGYKIELTKATRDGGKDIILRKPDILGDFIYYVECKKYASDNPIGVGIVREFSSVINWDKVNGGIIATTSYFAKDAKKLILDYNLGFQIQMHDYGKIQELLNRVV